MAWWRVGPSACLFFLSGKWREGEGRGGMGMGMAIWILHCTAKWLAVAAARAKANANAGGRDIDQDGWMLIAFRGCRVVSWLAVLAVVWTLSLCDTVLGLFKVRYCCVCALVVMYFVLDYAMSRQRCPMVSISFQSIDVKGEAGSHCPGLSELSTSSHECRTKTWPYFGDCG